MLYLAFIFLFFAGVLFWQSNRQKHKSGLPVGRVVYSDTRTWGRVEKPLYDPELSLTGRPDYLVEQGGEYIPVEVKSGRPPQVLYDSHIFQLAAYCWLVEKEYGRRPSHGVVHYPGRDFGVDYTPELEAGLLSVVAEMRRDQRRRQVPRSHAEPRRCARCAFRTDCDQRLG